MSTANTSYLLLQQKPSRLSLICFLCIFFKKSKIIPTSCETAASLLAMGCKLITIANSLSSLADNQNRCLAFVLRFFVLHILFELQTIRTFCAWDFPFGISIFYLSLFCIDMYI
ncbi:hypothetical protein CW304_32485 [Bacillus sp. UFRGS-B20]|nr:hypothetical protein CW304_32485 [Bacillus sp. UFRGS-B20]